MSVVIPNYNHSRYLPVAIESALNQTYRPLEVIVVDDGSTDDCREVVARFGGAVRYVFQENQGLAGARNTGILASQGEFVGLLDADDEWLPGFLESVVDLERSHPGTSVYYCCAQAVDEQGHKLPQVFGGPPVEQEDLRWCLLRANFIIPSTVVVRRQAVRSAGLFDRTLRSCEDWDLWLRLLPAHRFVGNAARLVRYRLHGSSLSANPDGMRHAALAVVAKHFGQDDEKAGEWPVEKRRAYGGVYRYLALLSIQRQRDWQGAARYLRRALVIDASLATDGHLFYDLALGSQPPGYRGTAGHLDLADNASRLEGLLGAVFDEDRVGSLCGVRRDALASALRAVGLVAYNTGHALTSLRFLSRALYCQPRLWRDRVVRGDWVKSLFGWPGLKRAFANARHRSSG